MKKDFFSKNKRIILGGILFTIIILKLMILETTKEGMEEKESKPEEANNGCYLGSGGDPCDFKNGHNYTDKYIDAKKYVINEGFQREMHKVWKSKHRKYFPRDSYTWFQKYNPFTILWKVWLILYELLICKYIPDNIYLARAEYNN